MMNIYPISFIFLAAVISSVAYADDARSFELYQPIIDKCLFGPPPEDPTVIPDKNSSSSDSDAKTERQLSKEQEQLEKSVAVSALIQKPDGVVMVGFSDMSAKKSPVHYYLPVGESKDGWTVVAADVTTKKIMLEKDGVEIERTLGDKGAVAASKANSPASSGRLNQPRSTLLSNRPGGLLRGNPGLMSRRAIRQQEKRLEEIIREEEREEDRKKEEAMALRREQESAERAEQRQSLLVLQEEMRKMREARERAKELNGQGGDQEL